ncbi:MAG: Fur family transcriptional regulator [Pirellulales bacterium]
MIPAGPHRFDSLLGNSGETLDRLRASLEEAGCRYTQQRAAVYLLLEQSDAHPTAADVYQEVRSFLPTISLATVYNALEALAAAGLVTKLASEDGSARFDARREAHYHFRDAETGQIEDLPVQFDPELLDKLQPGLVEQLQSRGITVTGYRLEVLGKRHDQGE